MNRLWLAFLPLFCLCALALTPPARAQTATPHEIQAMIAQGQPGQAIAALNNVLQAHPNSGIAWFLMAEAHDAQHDETDAAAALSTAEHLSPGLPFASTQDISALRAHINGGGAQGGGHILWFILGGVVLLFLLLRLMRRRSFPAPAAYGAPPPMNMPFGYGQPPGGGGLGSSLLGGLAAGVGFGAGERIIDGMLGNGQPNFGNNDQFTDNQTQRDDGLQGNPGWDDNSGGGGGGSDDSWS